MCCFACIINWIFYYDDFRFDSDFEHDLSKKKKTKFLPEATQTKLDKTHQFAFKIPNNGYFISNDDEQTQIYAFIDEITRRHELIPFGEETLQITATKNYFFFRWLE